MFKPFKFLFKSATYLNLIAFEKLNKHLCPNTEMVLKIA